MTLENIIVWIIVGAIAGWLAGKVVSGSGNGLVMNIIIGIIGSFIGGWLFTSYSGSAITGFNLPSILIATIGAIILLFIAKLFNRT